MMRAGTGETSSKAEARGEGVKGKKEGREERGTQDSRGRLKRKGGTKPQKRNTNGKRLRRGDGGGGGGGGGGGILSVV